MTTGYLIFADVASAQARSRTEAAARGCAANAGTQFWWQSIPHPVLAGQALLLVDDTRAAFAKATLQTAEKPLVLADPVVLAAVQATLLAPVDAGAAIVG